MRNGQKSLETYAIDTYSTIIKTSSIWKLALGIGDGYVGRGYIPFNFRAKKMDHHTNFQVRHGTKMLWRNFSDKKYDHIYKYSNLALCVNSLLKDMGHHVDYEILALRHAIKRPDIFVQHIFSLINNYLRVRVANKKHFDPVAILKIYTICKAFLI